jgi:hypothetical protein
MHQWMRDCGWRERRVPAITGTLVLLCMGLSGCLGGGHTGRLPDAPSRTVLAGPVRVRLCSAPDELPVIEVPVNGCGPYLFILDTGTEGLVLSRRILSQIKPRASGKTVTMNTQAGPRPLGAQYRINVVRIGSAEFHNLRACSANLSDIEALVGQKLGGVLGIGIFADCRLTIDYPAQQVLLELSGSGASAGEDAHKMVMPIDISEGPRPHIVLDIGGTKVRAAIDSGSKHAFFVPDDLLPRIHVASPPVGVYESSATFNGKIPIYSTRLDGSIFLGDQEFVRPIVQVLHYEPLLGHDALRDFRVSIDLRNRQASFTRTEHGPIGPPPSVRHPGFFWRQEADCFVVTKPIENKTLEQLGLKEGDRILTVNGIPAKELSNNGLRKLANMHDTLTLDIARDGLRASVNVPSAVLVP